ncbi:hypothetical protein CR513_14196, partial [Mucuna pruriens]
MASSFDSFVLLHVPRDQNERVDLLAKLASTQKRGKQRTIIHEKLSTSTIDRLEVLDVGSRTTWMTRIFNYLQNGETPDNPGEALKVVKEATKYTLLGQHLYRRGFSFPLLRCLEDEESAYVIKEVHEGVCGTHIGGRALANYFTKWIEAKSVALITTERIKRFGIPTEIVSDNDTQFASKETIKFCKELKIKQLFTSVEHPQSNGHAEAVTKDYGRGWKKLRTNGQKSYLKFCGPIIPPPYSTTNETSFRLTFDTEAMIPEAREIVHIKEYAMKARAARKYDRRIIPRDFKTGDLVLKKVTQNVDKNKLTPCWEEPFRILEEAGQGAY